jgi:hypothetical protein
MQGGVAAYISKIKATYLLRGVVAISKIKDMERYGGLHIKSNGGPFDIKTHQKTSFSNANSKPI